MSGINTNSNVVLGIFAIVALLAFFIVENSKRDVRLDWYQEKLEAASLARSAEHYIKDRRIERGVFVDATNDPNETALIGQDVTPMTTDRGFIGEKLASTNPNFAGVVVELLKQAGVRDSDCVAVALTGSFPGMNIAVLSAIQTLRLTPLIICSVGSSNFGANDPQWTWLDMERVLNEAGLFHGRSIAASIGGGGDVGRGLSPEGRDMILQAIKRNNIDMINEEHIEQSIGRRLNAYESHANGHPIRAYLNVGGGVASLGAVINGEIIPNGLSKELPEKNYPVRGVIIEMARRGIPVIHLYDVHKLWTKYDLPMNPMPLPEPGSGGVFVREKYNRTIAWSAVAFLSVMILVAGYVDRKRHRMGLEPVVLNDATADHEL